MSISTALATARTQRFRNVSLYSTISTSARLAPIRAGTPSKHAHGKPKKIVRYVPEEATPFYKQNGQFSTTKETRDWFLQHNIGHDLGICHHIPSCRNIATEARINVAFTPYHVIHPHMLKYLCPRGHPLQPKVMAELERKKLEEPLWYHWGCNAAKVLPTMRTVLQRRVRWQVLSALEELGYSATGKWQGKGEYKEIRGTLYLGCYDALHAVNWRTEDLAKKIAKTLDRDFSISASSGKADTPSKDSFSGRKIERTPITDLDSIKGARRDLKKRVIRGRERGNNDSPKW